MNVVKLFSGPFFILGQYQHMKVKILHPISLIKSVLNCHRNYSYKDFIIILDGTYRYQCNKIWSLDLLTIMNLSILHRSIPLHSLDSVWKNTPRNNRDMSTLPNTWTSLQILSESSSCKKTHKIKDILEITNHVPYKK